MTVPSEINRAGPYNGNGSTTQFGFGFRILSDQHIMVILSGGVGGEAVLSLGADYSVSGVGDAEGGAVSTVVAPPSGQAITILRNLPFTQETDLENQGAYFAETVEDALDAAAMRDQQLQEQVDRSVKIPISASPDQLDELISDIIRLGDSVDNIDAVAGSLASIQSVADNENDISVVADNIEDINSFFKVNIGSRPSDPSIRNDGSPLREGDIYFNTTLSEVHIYSSGGWLSITDQAMNLASKVFEGDGAKDEFELSVSPVVAQNVLVFVGGSLQAPYVDYTVDGALLVLHDPPPTGVSVVTLVISTTVDVTVPADASVTQSKLAPDVAGSIGSRVSKTGDAMSGPLTLTPLEDDPAAPENGTIWARAAGFFVRIAGATHQLLTSIGNQSIDGDLTVSGRVKGDGAELTGIKFAKSFTSSDIIVSLAGTVTLTHGLGSKPRLVTAKFRCIVAEHGYSVGQEVPYPLTPFFLYTNQSYCAGAQAYLPNNTQIGLIFGWSSLPALYQRTTGNQVYITAANWRLVVEAYL